MLVTMLQTQKGSPDGIQLVEYAEGATVDLVDDLARVFLEEGWATLPAPAEADAPAAPVERVEKPAARTQRPKRNTAAAPKRTKRAPKKG